MKKYYRIKVIERNKEYYGTNFFDSGYHYEYTPISVGHEYMFKVLEKFNETTKNKWCYIDIDITRIFGKQQSVIKIKGPKKRVNQFITTLLLSDFSNYFTFTECPYYDISYESYV